MSIIEFEMPLFHPKDCDCIVCEALVELFAERDALRSEVERLKAFEVIGEDNYWCKQYRTALAEVERLQGIVRTYECDRVRP